MKDIRYFIIIILGMLMTACEKPILAEEPEAQEGKTEDNLRVSIYEIEQTPFSALSRSSVGNLCTHLNFLIYDKEGNRVKQNNQKVGDSDYGTTSFNLSQGEYQLVAIGHSSKSNPTTTNAGKIQFTNADGYSDTFLYNTTITIGDEPETLSLSLSRIVSMCRFIIEDTIPEGVTHMQFEYKGGSGAFNASTGLGSVNSTQTVKVDVQAGQTNTQYDLYTFLPSTTGTIIITVSALDNSDNKMLEYGFEVPMQQNMISWVSGKFFSGSALTNYGTATTTVTINSQWAGELHFQY